MASMLGRAALRGGFRSLSARRSGLLLAGRRDASGSALSQLGGTNAAIIAAGVGVLGFSLYSVSVLYVVITIERMLRPCGPCVDAKG